MERLTQWFGYGSCRVAGIASHLEEKHTAEELVDILTARLADYEDAEQQRRFVVLPCKIGDEMWGLTKYNGHTKKVKQGIVTEMYFGDDMRLCVSMKGVGRGEFGKTVFLTREEAEAALAADINDGHKGGAHE